MIRRSRVSRTTRGSPLSSYYATGDVTPVLTKTKFDAALSCPKRLYYLEEGVALRHQAWFGLRDGTGFVTADDAVRRDWTAVDDDETPLEPGVFDRDGCLLPSGPHSSVSRVSIPDSYAAVFAQPPPSVLSRFVENNRVKAWCRLWYADFVASHLRVRPEAIKGTDEIAEARTLEIIHLNNSKNPVALLDAVVSFKRPTDGVVCRARFDALHFVPAAVSKTGQEQWIAHDFKMFIDAKAQHQRQLRSFAQYYEYVLRHGLGAALAGFNVVHISRRHRRKRHDLLAPPAEALSLAKQLLTCDPVPRDDTTTTDATDQAVDSACQLLREYLFEGPPESWSLHFGSGGDSKKVDAPDPKAAFECALQQRSLCSAACSQCYFSARCVPSHKALPNNVFTLPMMGMPSKAALWNAGVKLVTEVDPTELSASQARYQASVTHGPQLDAPSLLDFFSAIRYPLIVLDFESVAFPDPPFDHLTAYEQVPFQYSADVFYGDWRGTAPVHYDYIHLGEGVDPRSDPREAITKSLMAMFRQIEETAIARGIPHPFPAGLKPSRRPSSAPHIGAILAHNASFERNAIRKLELASNAAGNGAFEKRYTSDALPWLDSVTAVKALVVQEAGGSASLKNALPAFAPNSLSGSYSALGGGIRNGGDASGAFSLYARGWLDATDAGRVAADRAAFLAYCRLDTAGLVDVLRGIHTIARRLLGRDLPAEAPLQAAEPNKSTSSSRITTSEKRRLRPTPAAPPRKAHSRPILQPTRRK